MRWLRRKDRVRKEKKPGRMLAWALVLGFLYGLGGGIEFFEDGLRVARNRVNERDASGEIVLVGIDEKALREVGRWPWPRSRYAELIDIIGSAKPKQQVHDFMFPDKSLPAEDAKLAEAIERNSNVTLGYFHRLGARHQLRDHQVKLRVGLGLELAVLHDAGHLRVHLVRERLVLHAGAERGADVLHALAERRVGRPLLALVENEFRFARAVVVLVRGLAVGGGTGECERECDCNCGLPDHVNLLSGR